MPIIPRVGRKSPKIRLTIGLVYALLVMGGIAMVVPFMITLTLSVANYYEHERFDFYPHYLFSAKERYMKYLAQRYDFWELFPDFRSVYGGPQHWGSFRDLSYDPNVVDKHFPLFGAEEDPLRKQQLKRVYQDYNGWLKNYDIQNCKLTFSGWNMPRYQLFLLERYGEIWLEREGLERSDVSLSEYEKGSLATMAELAGTSYVSIHSIIPVREYHAPFDLQGWFPEDTEHHRDYLAFMRSRPTAERIPVTRHYLWTKYLFNKDIDLAKIWPDGPYDNVMDLPFFLPEEAPEELKKQKEAFMLDHWPVRLVKMDPARHQAPFLEFAKEQYITLEALNLAAKTDFTDWNQLTFKANGMDYDKVALRSLWRDYVTMQPRSEWQLLSPEQDYQQYLMDKFGSVAAINQAYGWDVKPENFRNLRIPIDESDYYHYIKDKKKYLLGFLTKNYGFAIHFLQFRGRAVFNTIVLVLLSIGAALTVNPLAAYALSRFRPRATHQILIFLLAVMAFPPMVAAIPGFLLLRDLHLLNTFAALILPGMANGYAIFLLKGFFDSLPQELYEAAAIDGAKEWQMFAQITMPLCKPILAVIALNTFIVAYGGFMWALIVCQKEEMWTLMVWMMQFNSYFAWMPFVTTAGMVLVSIPTLLVFVFCQKIILRGIVIPQMK